MNIKLGCWSKKAAVTGIVLLLLSGCASTVNDADLLAQCTVESWSKVRFDPQTKVIAVRHFAAGEEVRLSASPPPHPKAPVDVCMVKLLVGPGSPGPADAPSTTQGIGIEVWLPQASQWNGIIRAFGSGGWAGGYYADPNRLSQSGAVHPMFLPALQKGYAVSGSDHGHGNAPSGRNASPFMRPDGTINTALWRDFSERSLYEQAVKTKVAVRAYYGRAHRYAYFDGYSTGGRQAYKLAQKYPDQYDGILAGAPAFHWTRFITSELYPQVLMQRELGKPIGNAKLNAVSALALRSCGGERARWGFLLDPLACAYDPARDPQALCVGAVGEAGVVGVSTSPTCLTPREAQTVNRIWYGLTRNARAPEPGVDNARTGRLSTDWQQMWWGLSRGTDLTALAGEQAPFPIASQLAAILLGDPRIAQRGFFTNAKGGAADGWRELNYGDLVHMYDRGLQLQRELADINTDSVDLEPFRARGGKILSYHGWSDQLIMPQGSMHYFDRLVERFGSADEVQRFNRLFFIPGYGHSGMFSLTAAIGLDGSVTPAASVPLPQGVSGRDELFTALRRWVEGGQPPTRIDLTSANGQLSLPICAYPAKPVLTGTDADRAGNYTCR